jgi:DNA polymerase-3 subunit delta'
MMLSPWLQPLYVNLVAALTSSRLPHALLIHGPGGWGEWLLADALALRLIERDYSVSPSAAVVAHPDLRWVVPEGAGEQIKIDSVRSVADFMVQTPQIAPRKVAVLAGAEAMNPHAANALLKTLEEPPQDSYLILVSDSLGEMLPTIRSRCQLVAVRPSDTATTIAWVRDQSPTTTSVEHIMSLAFEYGRAPYRLLTALERDERPIAPQLCAVALRQLDPLQLAETWGRGSAVELVERWMRYLPLVLGGPKGAAGHADPLSDALSAASSHRVLNFWQRLTAARGLLRGTTNPNARLMLETLLLDWRDLAQPL